MADDDLDNYIKQSIQSLKPDAAKSKITQATQLARSKGLNVPDDVADDFYNLTKLESGRSHYLSDGKTVKMGPPTQNGDRAIGFSQVMPGTAKPYQSKGLDPMREPDNIAIGLSEFAKGGSDPIARRLAYLGGPKSTALREYQRTGNVSQNRAYSYVPGNNATYEDYVAKSGGYNQLDNYIQNQIGGTNNNKSAPNTSLDDYIQQSIKSLGNSTVVTPQTIQSGGEANQPAVLNDSQLPAYAETVNDIGKLPPTKTGVPVQPNITDAEQADIQALKSGTAQVGTTDFTANPPVIVNKQTGQTTPVVAKTPIVQAQPQITTNQQVSPQNTPNPATPGPIENDINPATGKPYQYGVDVSADNLQPVLNDEQKNQLQQLNQIDAQNAGVNNRAQNAYEYSQWLKNKGLPDSSENYAKFNQQKLSTQKLSQSSQNIDLSDYQGNDPARELAFRALKQSLAGKNVTDAEINMELDIEKAKGGYTRDNSGSSLDSAISSHFQSGDKNFDYIPQYGQLQNILNRREGKTDFTPSTAADIKDREDQELYNKLHPDDDTLRQQVIDDLTKEKQQKYNPTLLQNVNQAKNDAINPITGLINAGSKAYGYLTGDDKTGLSDDEINAEMARRRATEPTMENIQDASLKAKGLNSLLGGTVGGGGRTLDAIGGILRPLSSIGLDAPYKSLQEAGRKAALIEQLTGDDSFTSSFAKAVGASPWDIGRMTFFSLPAGGIVGLGADSFLQAAGRGERVNKLEGFGTQGSTQGGIFGLAEPVGEMAGNVSPILKPIARVGTVGIGTGLFDLASGADLPTSFKNGVMMSALDIAQHAPQLIGKVGRFAKDGKIIDIQAVEKDGKIEVNQVELSEGEKPDYVVKAPDENTANLKLDATKDLTPSQQSIINLFKTPDTQLSVDEIFANVPGIEGGDLDILHDNYSDKGLLIPVRDANGLATKFPIIDEHGNELPIDEDKGTYEYKFKLNPDFIEQPKANQPENLEPENIQQPETTQTVTTNENDEGFIPGISPVITTTKNETVEPNQQGTGEGRGVGNKESSNGNPSLPKDDFYNKIRGTDQKDYKRKVELLDGYKSLEDERTKRLDELNSYEPGSAKYKEIDKRINELDKATRLQVEQGAKHFNIAPDDFISVVNDYFENSSDVKNRLLPESPTGLQSKENDSNITPETPAEGNSNNNEQQQNVSNNAELPKETKSNETVESETAKSETKPSKPPTSTKNETVDEEREKRGLNPIIPEARREFGQVWDEAKQEFNKNSNAGRDLVESLQNNPGRTITDKDNAVLLHHKITLNNEFDKASQNLIDAFDSGDDAKIAEARIEVARLSDERNALDEVSKRAGTELGRGLSARRMLAKEDYSLASLEQQKRAANGGRPLTDAEHKQLVEVQKKLAETQKAYDDYRQNTDDHIAKIEANRKIKELTHEMDDPSLKAVRDLAQRITDKLEARASAARERRLKRGTATGTQLQAGIDPSDLKDLAEIGAHNIAKYGNDFVDWSTRMLSEANDLTEAALKKIYEMSQKLIDKTIGSKEVKERVKKGEVVATKEAVDAQGKIIENIKEKYASGDISNSVQKLAKEYIKQGIRDRESLISKVHDTLKEIDPDIDRRQTMDAISGYGKFKQLSKDAISQTLSDLKGQMRQMAKLEDIKEGNQPAKSGLERRVPSAEEKRLAEQVKSAQGKQSIPIEAVKKNLEKQIDSLDNAIKSKTPIEKNNRVAPTSPEIENLRTRKNELQKLYDETFGKTEKKPISDEQRLSNYKKSLQKRTLELEEKIKNNDFTRTQRVIRPITMDAEAMKLKAANERVKDQFQLGIHRDQLKARNTFEKVADGFAKWRRAEVLSSPATLAKLASAAMSRIVTSPIEEAVGGVLGKIPGLSRVAAKAQLEGGFNARAEAKAITSVFTSGMKDAWSTLMTGKSELNLLYGKKDSLPPSAIDFLGTLHAVEKAPVKRAAFTRAFEKIAAKLISSGVDVSDPMVQTKIALDAYEASNKAIFMQNNKLVTNYQKFVRGLETKDANGKVSVGGKVGATAAKTLLPVVKIPVNYVGEALQYAVGSVISGPAKLGLAFWRGIENLEPAEADAIMRHFKKGSLGLAGLLLGFFNPNSVGGYYQPGDKKKDDEPQYGGVKIFGINIPRLFVHNPLLETLQIGATVRRVADSYLSKKSGEKRGLPAGMMAGFLGLTGEVPFIQGAKDIKKLYDPNEYQQYLDELGKSLVVPQGIDWAAKVTDKDKDGKYINRKPEGLVQNIESGIPGLRQNVPVKVEKPEPIGNKVRSGELSKEEAQAELQQQKQSNDISQKKLKSQSKDLNLSEGQKEIKTSHLESEADIKAIENIIIKTPDADKAALIPVLQKKIMSARKDSSNQGRQNADALQNLYNKYFSPAKP